jgi:hypothetical protein
MGFEHERIHIETSSVLMRELPLALLRRPPQWPAYHPSTTDAARQPPPNELIAGGCGCGRKGQCLGLAVPFCTQSAKPL